MTSRFTTDLPTGRPPAPPKPPHAVKRGTLAAERLESYRKLERELEYVAGKQDESLRIARTNRWKAIAKQHRQREKARAKYGRM